MKRIKSLLAIATVALLGSSAQAAEVTRTISIGDTFTATASKGTTADGGRWWMLTAGSSATDSQAAEKTDAALQIVGISFVDEAGNPTPGSRSDMENMSKEHVISTAFTFTGKSAGTVTFRLFGTTPPSPESKEYPDPIPNAPRITQGSWSNSNLDYYTITVREPELVENPVEVTATRITFAEGETKSAAKYVGYETKAGNLYACGKDDKPTEDFRTSDGSPHEKLDGTTQLFVVEAK